MNDELRFYASPGFFTSDINASEIEEDLKTGILDVSEVISGLAYHEAFSAEYGVEIPKDRPDVDNVRRAADLLTVIRTLDARPLNEVRPIERRLPTYCRQFSVLTSALLRMAGVPVRSRCGFCPAPNDDLGVGRFLDHWWVERWDSNLTRWVRMDTAMDKPLVAALALNFNPKDIPSGKYLSGAEAWQRCKSGEADPDLFGVPGIWGAGMVRGNVVRDLAALNKVEMLPWDQWDFVDESPIGDGANDFLVDEVAQAVLADDWHHSRRLYEENSILRPSDSLLSAMN